MAPASKTTLVSGLTLMTLRTSRAWKGSTWHMDRPEVERRTRSAGLRRFPLRHRSPVRQMRMDIALPSTNPATMAIAVPSTALGRGTFTAVSRTTTFSRTVHRCCFGKPQRSIRTLSTKATGYAPQRLHGRPANRSCSTAIQASRSNTETRICLSGTCQVV